MKTVNHILFLSTLLFFASCDDAADPVGETSDLVAETDQPVSDCSTAPDKWFKEVDGVRVTPAPNEGDSSVFANNATVTNCDFQRWAWQKFLYLMNTTEVGGKPYFLKEFTQVSSVGATVGTKDGPVILTDTMQASNNVLKSPAQNGQPQHTIYYSIMANDLFLETMKTYAPAVNNGTDSTTTFPVGAVEMKTAWIDVAAIGSDSDNYYVTAGEINGQPTQVALLGIHVVGIVKNHPEFVWATFEHDDLAPKYDWSQATHTTDATVTSTSSYPLFAANSVATYENINSNSRGLNTNVFTLYEHGVPLEIDSSGNKVYMSTSQVNPATTTIKNIEGLNSSVKSKLNDNDICKHYFLNSSIWINTEDYVGNLAQALYLDSMSYHLSNSSPGDLTRGSVSAFNITMETYVQYTFDNIPIHEATVDGLVNCFSCHNSNHGSGPNSPLKISHLFNGYAGSLTGLSKAEVKARHVEISRANAIKRKLNINK